MMRELRRDMARLLAYLYVFFVRSRHKIRMTVLLGVALIFCLMGGRHLVSVMGKDVVVMQSYLVMQPVRNEQVDSLVERLCVMVDAGHGGKDPGAIYGEIYEKDIALAVAKKLCAILEEQKIEVIMTRQDDVFVDKYDRVRMANQQEVDLFVSIHVNDLKQTGYSGIETYCGHIKRAGKQFASLLHQSVVDATGAKDLGVDASNYVVVKYTKMPAALIEIGFMSNREEREKMTSQAYQQLLAQGIADGILNYADTYLEDD